MIRIDRQSAQHIRDWARRNNIPVGTRGRLSDDLIRLYAETTGRIRLDVEGKVAHDGQQ